jgi:peptide/nickel transport system permease protein
MAAIGDRLVGDRAMNLGSYVVRRIAGMIPVALGVVLLVFFMVRLIPGDPARTMLGMRATAESVARLHKQWGLDQSLPVQFGHFLVRILRGDLGESMFFREPVGSLILGRLPTTLWLLVQSTVLALIIAVPLAALAASKKDGLRDHIVRTIPLAGLGFPQFWVGIILILLVALPSGGIFPVAGYGQGFFGHATAMFLPSVTIALSMSPILIRSLRASLLDVLEADYITTARSKGLSRRRILMSHSLRNAVVSSVTVLGVNIGYLIGGTLVVEQVFGIPGIGSLMIRSIFVRDFPVVQGVTLFVAVLVMVVYLLTDVAYALLDPRVRFD